MVTIGNGVQVPVLPGWQVVGQGDSDVLLGDGQNSFVYAVTGTVDPSADAASVIAASIDSILPKQTYTQLRKTDIAPLQAFGSVVSIAAMQYQATWTDQQASVPLQGLLICAVRQDGTALIITAEHAPPDEFKDSSESWAPVVNAHAGPVRRRLTARFTDSSADRLRVPRLVTADESAFARQAGTTRAVAMAATPSPRPVRPRPSVVVAETVTGAPAASLSAASASARRAPSRGRLPITWTATLPIANPAARTRRGGLGEQGGARRAGPRGVGRAELAPRSPSPAADSSASQAACAATSPSE